MRYKNHKSNYQYRVRKNLIFTSKFFVLLLFILPIIDSTQAYTSAIGVEYGDVVDITYSGVLNDGSEFDSGTLPSARIVFQTDGGELLDAFIRGVLSAKLNTPKTFTVYSGEGYSDGDLANKDLIFTITITNIVQSAGRTVTNPDDSNNKGSDNSEGAATKLKNIVLWIIGIAASIFVIIAFRSILQKQTTAGCVHCKMLGKSQISEGKCGKCGMAYCRNSFSRGCPNCKSNTFIPYT